MLPRVLTEAIYTFLLCTAEPTLLLLSHQLFNFYFADIYSIWHFFMQVYVVFLWFYFFFYICV